MPVLPVSADTAANPPELIAPSVPVVTFVTADPVVLAMAFRPYNEMVHEVEAAAKDSKCPMTYSPGLSSVEANVIG